MSKINQKTGTAEGDEVSKLKVHRVSTVCYHSDVCQVGDHITNSVGYNALL